MKTHKVLDLHYTTEEGQDDFVGAIEECQEYVSKQTVYFMYKIVELSAYEINFYNNETSR